MLRERLRSKRVILGSGSPRRKHLLEGLDVDFTVETRETDESWPGHLSEEGIPQHIALMKSLAFGDLAQDTILVTADTIVWAQNKAVNKPTDAEEAKAMLASLSGETHYVYTGVVVRTHKGSNVFSDETVVEFRKFSEEEIEYYVKTYKPFDKAGGYGAQDWLGYIGIERIDGCYYNVMGLPVRKVYQALNELGSGPY
jgi:septum formation protein